MDPRSGFSRQIVECAELGELLTVGVLDRQWAKLVAREQLLRVRRDSAARCIQLRWREYARKGLLSAVCFADGDGADGDGADATVLLVGGTSRLWKIKQTLKDLTEKSQYIGAHATVLLVGGTSRLWKIKDLAEKSE